MSVQSDQLFGDPAGMRALAGDLRARAAAVAGVDAAVTARVGTTCFAGPAAIALQGRIETWHGQVSGVVEALVAAATLLDRTATTIEDELAELARRQRSDSEGCAGL